MKQVPEGAQNFLEWLVEGLYGFLEGLLGAQLAKKTFWFFGTVFIFILASNWLGLVPGVGSMGWGHYTAEGFQLEEPFFRGANADVNLTLAMALVFFACWIVWGLQALGPLGFFKEMFAPKGTTTGALKVLMGRVLNVTGAPVDERGPVVAEKYYPIHRPAPSLVDQSTSPDVLSTGIKVIDLICPFLKGGKIGAFGGAGVGKTVVIMLGAGVGTLGSTINPFATVIASNAAGVPFTNGMPLRFLILGVGWLTCVVYVMRYAERVKRDPSKSLVANLAKSNREHFLKSQDATGTPPLTGVRKIILLLFGLSFAVMSARATQAIAVRLAYPARP